MLAYNLNLLITEACSDAYRPRLIQVLVDGGRCVQAAYLVNKAGEQPSFELQLS